MTQLVHLRHGDLELELCPAVGGTIAAFRWRGHDVMRPAGPRFLAARRPGDASCFPLVPFSNRIADARFTFQGRVVELAKNFPPEPHAIHGQGWQHPWQVSEVSGAREVLTFAHAIADTPFDYRARQLLELSDDGLEVALELTHAGAGPMPAGIGLHPYFPRTDGVMLRARLDHVWLPDARKIPADRVGIPPAWDFSNGLRIAALDLDHCFGGWDGTAEIHWPETDLTLRIEADSVLGNLVIYVPPGENFFCVEPVSNVNDGFNLMARGIEGTGVRVLEPGDVLSARVAFRLR